MTNTTFEWKKEIQYVQDQLIKPMTPVTRQRLRASVTYMKRQITKRHSDVLARCKRSLVDVYWAVYQNPETKDSQLLIYKNMIELFYTNEDITQSEKRKFMLDVESVFLTDKVRKEYGI